MTKNDANYEIKERSANEVTVQVTVAAPVVKNGVEAIYRRYGQEMQIPGFRKGRVPRSFLDARFGRKLFLEEAQNELKERHLKQAITSLELNPVTTPQLAVVSDEDEGEFVFTTSFSILPTIELPEYRGIELAVEPEKVISAEDIQKALDQLCHRCATTVTKDEAVVASGNIVHIQDGEEKWKAHVEEDSASAVLIGSKIGDTVEVNLPDEGVEHASLTILGVEELVLPEIDDDLAKTAGLDNLAALKENIKENLAESVAHNRKQKIRIALLDRLVEQVEIPLPESFIAEIVKEEMEKMKQDLAELSISFEDRLEKLGKSEEELLAEQHTAVTARLQRELLLTQIAEKEGITVDDDELEKLASDEAVKKHQDPLRFVAQIKANDRWEEYRTTTVNTRVIDIMYNEARLTEEGE
ncbi:trigger factor [Candidatus Bipolaricaulota bacterium]|nr:trigger factor [Candidatus Bipolaricaulota bacterium]